MFFKKRKVVGIYSREHESLYQWLVRFLLSISVTKDIRPSNISNDFRHFEQEAAKCDFAILYHSKRRGRVNVTDVTDSLYDRELRHLNQTHGKDRVLVVIDDLEDGSDEVKQEILNGQPSIGQLAEELFIFSTREKDFLKDGAASGYQRESVLGDKLGHMEKLIKGTKVKRQNSPGTLSQETEGIFGPNLELGRCSQLRRQIPCNLKCIIIVIIVVLAILVIVLPLTLSH